MCRWEARDSAAGTWDTSDKEQYRNRAQRAWQYSIAGIENERLRIEGIRFVTSQDTAATLQQLRIDARAEHESKTMFF